MISNEPALSPSKLNWLVKVVSPVSSEIFGIFGSLQGGRGRKILHTGIKYNLREQTNPVGNIPCW